MENNDLKPEMNQKPDNSEASEKEVLKQEQAEQVVATDEKEKSKTQVSPEEIVSEDAPLVESDNAPEEVKAAEPEVETTEPEAAKVVEDASPAKEVEISEDEAAVEPNQKEELEEAAVIVKEKARDVAEEVVVIDDVDHETLDKQALVQRLNYFLQNIDITSSALRREVEAIKNSFYKQYKKEVQEIRERFLEDGGEEKDFMVAPDPTELLLKDMLGLYRSKRAAFHKDQESQKTENLAIKYKIIEEIKALEQGEESLNQTFKVFRELQEQWRTTGPVPQANVKHLYENYHHHVERFYDYIKINKDLRDLDLKKNGEAKVKLCERAEGLIDAENVLDAFSELQELHLEWREVGPVHKEEKEVLWERFKEATAHLNKRHQKHYEDIKTGQKENLDKKTALCEKVEALAAKDYDKPKAWNQKSDEILEIQKEWRGIGFAPKKYNTRIYERFRAGCDVFFNKKRDFYQKYKNIQDQNYEAKLKLVETAESLKDSSNWKHDSDVLIKIQREWKQIGPVPRKHSDEIWKRFRGACDAFFKHKSDYFKDIDSVYAENLKKKHDLIAEVKSFKGGKDDKETIQMFEDFKSRWNEIGHVPFKEKDAVYNEFKSALNAHYDNLQMDDVHKEVEKFKSKIDDMQNAPNSYDKVSAERQRLFNKLKKLEGEVATLENNIGFFSSSSKSASLLKGFENKIKEAKETINVITRKIKLLDKME